MTESDAYPDFLTLVAKVSRGTTARSENDLSSRLSRVLESLDLSTVIDTGPAEGGRKRPDILGYVSRQDADLVLPAEIVIEAKQPSELASFSSLSEVLADADFWEEKTFPYLTANLTRVRYFCITTFESFLAAQITDLVRGAVAAANSPTDEAAEKAREALLSTWEEFDLTGKKSATDWKAWTTGHFAPSALTPPPLSSIRDTRKVETSTDIHGFASRLAEFAAGRLGDQTSRGLFHAIRPNLSESYSQLSPEIRRDLHLFLMGKNPGMSLSEVKEIAQEDLTDSLDEFLAASIHSLISRLFVLSVVEDAYCRGRSDPLLEPDLWVVNRDEYDDLSPPQLVDGAFDSLHQLRESDNAVLKSLAVYGFFFDWIRDFLDPVAFRSLVDLFVSHYLGEVQGDVLGRFYELYLQEIDQSRRKELGQYYTPYPIVRFMWRLAAHHIGKQQALSNVRVLDPGMGSGTFLAEGSHVLAHHNVSEFWKKIVGFDIAGEILGIAHANVYMAVLSEVPRSAAFDVNELGLYTTDSLDPRNGQYLEQILPLITSEQDRAFIENRVKLSTELKQPEAFYLAIGNPPYRNNSRLTLRQVAERFPRLLAKANEEARAQERNIRDDYAWFFAAADHYITDPGLICFICSDSFALKFSYRHFREELLRYYTIRALWKLGNHVFEDVGPRISFCIILLERRSEPLTRASDAEPVPFWNLAPLVDGVPQGVLGTNEDPRFLRLQEISGEDFESPDDYHRPQAEQDFLLYPQGPVVDRMRRHSMPVYKRSEANRIFRSKWPGIITAFDAFFKADSRAELHERIESFYSMSKEKDLSDFGLHKATVKWAKEREFDEKWYERLVHLAKQIQKPQISFSSEKIKRTFGGSIPSGLRWFPPPDSRSFIYYEPQLHIPRKKHAGKRKGWGTMEQWRAPESHLISPKLVYTTASKVRYGYRAFVLNGEWYLKLHGGTSQQFHYTGLDDPNLERRSDGKPNNLTEQGQALLDGFLTHDGDQRLLLHYISAILNSDLAQSFLANASSGLKLGIRIPKSEAEWETAVEIADSARVCRTLSYLKWLDDLQSGVPKSELEELIGAQAGEMVGMAVECKAEEGFKPELVCRFPPNVKSRIETRLAELEDSIEASINSLYG